MKIEYGLFRVFTLFFIPLTPPQYTKLQVLTLAFYSYPLTVYSALISGECRQLPDKLSPQIIWTEGGRGGAGEGGKHLEP